MILRDALAVGRNPAVQLRYERSLASSLAWSDQRRPRRGEAASQQPSAVSRAKKLWTGEPDADALYSNRAECKILASRVAMHLSESQRRDLFAQLDELLSPDAWEEGDSLIDAQSYATLLRFLIYFGDIRRPSLTVSSDGAVAASWFQPSRRLTISFLAHDRIRCVVYRKITPDDTESAAFETRLLRLDDILKPFEANGWFRTTPSAAD